MSKYTTEVRFICETYAGKDESVDYDDVNSVIESSRTKVFDFYFPIYDESYRSILETKILRHYYTREIGLETVALWKHFLNMRLNEIMPYYNQLYKSTVLEFNPFYDVDLTTTANRNIGHDETSSNTRTDDLKEGFTSKNTRTDNLTESTSNNSDTTTSATRTDNLAHHDKTETDFQSQDAYSDTPQGTLGNVENLTYLTNARAIHDITDEENNGTNTGTVSNNGTQNVKGTGTVNNTGTQTVDFNSDKNNTGTQKNDGTRNYKSTDEYLEHVYGKRGGATYSALLQEYRKTFINIDTMIINELSDLFMNVW